MSLRWQMILLSVVILASLGLHWAWLSYRFKKKTENADAPQASLGEPSERIEPATSMPIGLPEGAASASAEPMELADFPLPVMDRRSVLNPLIDCIATLLPAQPCSGEQALSVLPSTRRIGSKSWLIEGHNTQTQSWEPVFTGQSYDAFQAGIQLVNRHGALNEVEFSEFVVKAGEVAEGLGASAEFPEMLEEVARARELDQFVMGVDIRLSLHLHAKRAAWSLPYVQQHAQRLGFVAGVIPGRWVLLGDKDDMIALTIDLHAALADDVNLVPIRSLALTLDVPQVSRGGTDKGRPFDAMTDVAIRLCASMEAMILDEQGGAVDAAMLQRTATELEAVYDRLDAFGTPAGSTMAKRLFS